MTDIDNIIDVANAGADWIGMIFYPESPRYVPMVSSSAGILPDKAKETDKARPNHIKHVGVFVDDMAQNIITRVVNYHLDIVQLHGKESPTLIKNLRHTIDPDIHKGIRFIKAIHIATEADFCQCRHYEGVVDYFLFDTKSGNHGGSGKQFDWNLLKEYQGATPFLLSGGIGPDDVYGIKKIGHPMMMGVDVNSLFETRPGIKDSEAVRTFISKINGKP